MKKGQVVIYTGSRKSIYGERLIYKRESHEGSHLVFNVEMDGRFYYIPKYSNCFYPVRR